ncbi:hypothetical protein HAX54_044339 [Datura stramonium]|uniref:Uncharacterized protein n=1 Tax=Datura stramonium TaxID=4076 RepID=A0ABS8SPP6_DATST|nr:hypothetical protein [Datura stramonium]
MMEWVESNIMSDHILVHFPQIDDDDNNNKVEMKCVRFVTNGTIEFSNVTMNNTCISQGQGHFAIVVPSLKPEEEKKKGKWKWWVIDLEELLILLLIVMATLICKCVGLKKEGNMERQSEKK